MSSATQISATIQTNFTPAFSFNPLQKVQGSSAVRNAILKLVQPSIDIDLPVVGKTHYAPYGEPTGLGLVALVVVLALAILGAASLLKSA